MANRTYLIRVDECPCPMDKVRDEQYLLQAKHGIPAFWFMLFSQKSIVDTEEPPEEDDEAPLRFPCMVSLAAEALALAQSRWRAVESAIGPSYEPLFRHFCDFIQSVPGQYIQCDTTELWWMYEPDTDEMLFSLRVPIAAFTKPFYETPKVPGRPEVISKQWEQLLGFPDEILGRSRPSAKYRTKPDVNGILCGWGCSRNAPWQSE